MAIGSFRRAVSSIIPEMTRVALINRRAELVRDTPNFDKRNFSITCRVPATRKSGAKDIAARFRFTRAGFHSA